MCLAEFYANVYEMIPADLQSINIMLNIQHCAEVLSTKIKVIWWQKIMLSSVFHSGRVHFYTSTFKQHQFSTHTCSVFQLSSSILHLEVVTVLLWIWAAQLFLSPHVDPTLTLCCETRKPSPAGLPAFLIDEASSVWMCLDVWGHCCRIYLRWDCAQYCTYTTVHVLFPLFKGAGLGYKLDTQMESTQTETVCVTFPG